MALDFLFVSLEKDSHNRHYNAEIVVDGRRGKYEIYTNAHFYLNGQLDIWDGDDRAFDSEGRKDLSLCIKALDVEGRVYETRLRKAILEFIDKECSENDN